ncbi:hypothetical protein ACTMTJ_19170 [Phytohabitans sp. LJ34]|uniref:hypothetical protein n=1 Tax=Phytohabitans sp. LJ34 TaxID=3452217 RepID=UPI003F8BCD32
MWPDRSPGAGEPGRFPRQAGPASPTAGAEGLTWMARLLVALGFPVNERRG